MIIPYDRMLRTIDGASNMLTYIQQTYPTQYTFFIRFRKANGDHCSFVRACLKEIFIQEKEKSGQLYLLLAQHD